MSIFDSNAGFQSCWLECENSPSSSALKYLPSEKDLFYMSSYSDDSSRGQWNDHVLFFSCLEGCRTVHRKEYAVAIIGPCLAVAALLVLIFCCLICRGCPLHRWWNNRRKGKQGQQHPVKQNQVAPFTRHPDQPIMVSTVYGGGGGFPQPYGGSQRRRGSTLARKLHSLENTYSSLPVPQYDPMIGWVGGPVIEEEDTDSTYSGSTTTRKHRSRHRRHKSRSRNSGESGGGSSRGSGSNSGSVRVARY